MAEVYDSRADMLEMPTEYKELSEEEKEYDGGFAWWPVSLAVSAIGWTCSIVGKKTNNKALQTAGNIITIAGMASTGYGIVSGARLAAKTVISTSKGADFAYNCTIGVLDGAVGMGSMIKK